MTPEQSNKKCEHQVEYENNKGKWILFKVNMIGGGCEVKKRNEKQFRIGKSLNVVHQNIRSLWGKREKLEVLLETEINNAEVLCFTEHWLNCHKIHAINITISH